MGIPSETFEVRLTKAAEKDLEELRPWQDRVVDELLELEEDPHKGHPLTGTLKGVHSLQFSLPGGAYRAAYLILETERICLIFIMGPHEGFYKRAERRARAL